MANLSGTRKYKREWHANKAADPVWRAERNAKVREYNKRPEVRARLKKERAARKEYQAQYQQDNAGKISAYQAKYREENHDRIVEGQAKYFAENKSRYVAHSAKRKAAKLQRTPPWADMDAINFFYECCPEGCEVDHIIPLQGKSVSGFHVETNLQWLPIAENRSKGNKWPI